MAVHETDEVPGVSKKHRSIVIRHGPKRGGIARLMPGVREKGSVLI